MKLLYLKISELKLMKDFHESKLKKGSTGYYHFNFNFITKDWNKYEKIVIEFNDGNNSKAFLYEGSPIALPDVFSNSKYVDLKVFGKSGDVSVNTNKLTIFFY